MLHAMTEMNGAAARDVNHINEAINATAFLQPTAAMRR